MPLKYPKPPRRIGTYTKRVKDQAVVLADRSEDAGKAGFRLAQTTDFLRRQGFSFRQIERCLADPEFQAISPGIRLVTAQRLQQLHARYKAGARSQVDFVPGRRGRRSRPIAPEARAEARRLVLTQGHIAPMTQLQQTLNAYIVVRGLGEPISYGRFKRLVADVSREVRTSAAHGVRAGELYGSSHATVACRATHQIWTIDAFDAPWWEKALITETLEWVMVRPSIIIVKDYKSDAVVGYHISDPTRRRDGQGRICTEGFDSADVYAAILAAAIPALASPSTVALSGHLCDAIRWDRHSVNESLRDIMCAAAERLALEGDSFFGATLPDIEERLLDDGSVERCLLQIPRLPARRPKNRGDVERAIGFLKQLCWNMPGHERLYAPTPLLATDPRQSRTVGASVNALVDRQLPLAIEHVPTREETAPEFDALIAHYNAHRNRRTGQTRLERFHAFMPRSPRKGVDALALLETTSAFVTGEGIEVFHDSVSTLFEPYIAELRMRYGLDAQVTGKADVFYRGFFVRVGTQVFMLPVKDTWASEPGNAERAAREQRAVARQGSREADSVRRRQYEMQFGIGSVSKAFQEAEALRLAREEEKKARVPRDGRPRAGKRLVGAAAVHDEARATRDEAASGSTQRAARRPDAAPPLPVPSATDPSRVVHAASPLGPAIEDAFSRTPKKGRRSGRRRDDAPPPPVPAHGAPVPGTPSGAEPKVIATRGVRLPPPPPPVVPCATNAPVGPELGPTLAARLPK